MSERIFLPVSENDRVHPRCELIVFLVREKNGRAIRVRVSGKIQEHASEVREENLLKHPLRVLLLSGHQEDVKKPVQVFLLVFSSQENRIQTVYLFP